MLESEKLTINSQNISERVDALIPNMTSTSLHRVIDASLCNIMHVAVKGSTLYRDLFVLPAVLAVREQIM